ncbi:hypothetical protein M8C21_002400, partial [Ambrosia artemisiifolia]
LPTVTGIEVESIVFPPYFKPPGATNTLFLGGAGVRCVEIESKFVKVTVIGVYLEDKAIPSLAVKWKGKSAEELKGSLEFYRDITNGSFEKCLQVTTILSLTGEQFSQKLAENSISFSKDGIIPEAANVVLEIEKLGQAITEMIIGKHGVSPEVKQNLASRFSDIMN